MRFEQQTTADHATAGNRRRPGPGWPVGTVAGPGHGPARRRRPRRGRASRRRQPRAGTPNPHGVLKYGVDLDETFSGTFDPAPSTNDCSYTEYTALYDSLLVPGQHQGEPAAGRQLHLHAHLHHLPPPARAPPSPTADPVTAATVAASIDHIKTSPYRFSLSYIQSVQVVDPETVTFQLNKPVAGDVLWAMTYIDGMQLDPSALPTTTTVPASSGPFTLASYQQGSSLVLKANPTYWNKSAYKLGGVDFVQVSRRAPAGQRPRVGRGRHAGPPARGLRRGEGTAQHRHRHHPVVRLPAHPDPTERRAVQRPQGAGGHGVRRRPHGHQPGRLLRAGPAGLPALPERERRPSTSRSGDKYTYQPKKAKAMLAAAGHPNGREVHPGHPRAARPPSAARPRSCRPRWPRPGST